jgi:ESF2/ABP1 family protein
MAKRKRVAADIDAVEPKAVHEAPEAEGEEHSSGESEADAQDDGAESAAESEVESDEAEAAADAVSKKKPLKPLSKRRVEAYNEALRKRGIVYLSRVPPFMKPAKVKSLLERHGPIARVSLNNCMLIAW